MIDRKKWHKWHSLAGIKFSILICFILVTGTFAVVSHEIDWLTNASQRVWPQVTNDKVNWPAIYSSAIKINPIDPVISLHAPLDPWFAAQVLRRNAKGDRYRQFFHPVSGRYQGDGRWYNWQRFFRMSHRHLMLPTLYGITLVCCLGLVMFVSMISGMVIYPKWWRGFFRKPRTGSCKAFWNDVHRLFGLWSSWLLLVVCLTGIWYLLELWGLRAHVPQEHYQLSPQAEAEAVRPSAAAFTDIISRVPQYHTNLAIKRIRLPERPGESVIVEGQDGTKLVRDRANNVEFDPVSAQYLARRYASGQSFHVRISEAADPLHFGTFAGIYSKAVYFFFGVLLSALAISGTYLYGLRHTRVHRTIPVEGSKVWRSS
ncbi:PepSY domain-containing protein [Thalassomonas viridans]|uniref:PepSY domain-containing protein n=1 Tax=Thalassomonas viridans TaxID=137584 RepID=A0AAE9Z8L7_9GAMM|nr:PepSY-associated TM helix domain-containing protein [Thalassomonas viridans]WDE07097.1 PepSY domain-containing protein [Thalassomonas viridans]